MSLARASLKITGVVQNVGYRYFCFQKATELKLSGRARNDFDGAVSLTVEGERSAIEQLVQQLKIGPPASRVAGLNIDWSEYSGEWTDFRIDM